MQATVSSIHINGWFGDHDKLAGARWILRELTGGVYFGEPKEIVTLENGEKRAVDTQVYNTREIDRIAGLPLPQGHPLTLQEIARERGVPVAEIIAGVEAAVAKLQARNAEGTDREGQE